MILYSNGCSYTANLNIARDQRYPLLVGKHFGWSVVDRAQPGACNDRIIRCTMRDCLGLLAQEEPITALVQLTHLARTEYAGAPKETTAWKYWKDQYFESVKPGEPDLPSEVDEWMNLHLVLFDQQAATSKLFCSLIGLTNFFKQHSIKYQIFNGIKELTEFDPEIFYDYLSKDPGVIDLKNFDMLSLTGYQQHPTPTGMVKIADYFIDLLD